MRVTRVSQQATAAAAAAKHRTPSIHFLGKRTPPSMSLSASDYFFCTVHTNTLAMSDICYTDSPLFCLLESVDHAAHAHPAAPTNSLPDSFAAYRSKAQQHGPLNHRSLISSVGGAIGGHSGRSLGPVEPTRGQYFDRNELPPRFRRLPWTQIEIDAVETGGASLYA